MKKLFTVAFLCSLILTGCGQKNTSAAPEPEIKEGTKADQTAPQNQEQTESKEESILLETDDKSLEERQIEVRDTSGKRIVFALNNSAAADTLYDQLPLSVQVENYSDNEKIFYTPENLDLDDAPAAGGKSGTLASYIPWGNVIMFYSDFGTSDSLAELGYVVSGMEQIEQLSGTIEVTVLMENGEQLEGPTEIQAEEQTKEQLTKEQLTKEQQTVIPKPAVTQESEETDVTDQTLTLTIEGQEFTAAVENNETTKAFLSMLPLTLNMNDFNGNEKVISLPESIRKEDSSCPGTIHSGDIMCYGSDQLVIFYDTFSTVYSYVKIGHIDDVEGYEAALGSGSVEVTFSLK